MGRVIRFDYMDKNEVLSHVDVYPAEQRVEVIDYTNDIVFRALGKRPHTIENVNWFFRRRCFDETRHDAKEILKVMGLSTYYPYAICRKTNGMLTRDNCWIRWEGETRTWEQIMADEEQAHDDIKDGKYTIEEYYARRIV